MSTQASLCETFCQRCKQTDITLRLHAGGHELQDAIVSGSKRNGHYLTPFKENNLLTGLYHGQKKNVNGSYLSINSFHLSRYSTLSLWIRVTSVTCCISVKIPWHHPSFLMLLPFFLTCFNQGFKAALWKRRAAPLWIIILQVIQHCCVRFKLQMLAGSYSAL